MNHVLPQKGRNLVERYLQYKTHACRETYTDLIGWTRDRQARTEEEWPEYANSAHLVNRPKYLQDSTMQGAAWLRE